MVPAGNIIHLIGFPGVGKLTIAKEIIKEKNHVLMDAHMINNPIFSIIGADGVTPLPDGIWSAVARMRDVVLDAMENLAPKNFTFVMTNVILADAEDKEVTDRIERIANQRGGKYFPVILTCALEENKKRIIGLDRANNFKSIDPNEPDRRHDGTPLASFDNHPNRLLIDTTITQPDVAADMILIHVKSVAAL
jgi:hypothetical protein